MQPVWDEIEQTLVKLYSMPHNQPELRAKGTTPQAQARKEVAAAFPANPLWIKQYQNLGS